MIDSIFIRAETFQNEYRTPLVPEDIQTLIQAGIQVYVQSSLTRIFPDKAYSDISLCQVTTKSWTDPEFQNCFILGIKELDHLDKLNAHTQVYFSHSLKQQGGAQNILTRFSNSQSKLYDYEYFTDASGNRLIAFGWFAGVVGAVLGLQEYGQQQKDAPSIHNLTPWHSFKELLESIPSVGTPNIAVLGPHGRCGQGVCAILKRQGLMYTAFTRDSSIENLEEFDIVYNCIQLDQAYTKVWYTEKTPFFHETVIVDISCDYSKPNNPIMLYTKPTNWLEPVHKPHSNVSLIAIENLPSLLPQESSYHFSKLLVSCLLEFPGPVWTRALDVFKSQIPLCKN